MGNATDQRADSVGASYNGSPPDSQVRCRRVRRGLEKAMAARRPLYPCAIGTPRRRVSGCALGVRRAFGPRRRAAAVALPSGAVAATRELYGMLQPVSRWPRDKRRRLVQEEE